MTTSNNLNNQNHTIQNSGRGFAGMDPQKQHDIASQGGKAAHISGNAHKFTSDEAREAGRRGGLARNQQTEE